MMTEEEAADRMMLVLASASRQQIDPVELADVCAPFYDNAVDLYGLVCACLEVIRHYGTITPLPGEMVVLEIEDGGMPMDPKADGVLTAARMVTYWLNGDRDTADALFWPLVRDVELAPQLADLVVAVLRVTGGYMRRRIQQGNARNN